MWFDKLAHYIPYPHGKLCASLGSNGLVGKVHLTSDMTIEEVGKRFIQLLSIKCGVILLFRLPTYKLLVVVVDHYC